VSTLEAFILGIIQGISEFLPVSSSGHLMLGQHLFGLNNLQQNILFDLFCHLGTLFAIFFVYGTEIKNLFINNRLRLKQIVIGTLPLFPLLLILKPVESTFDQTRYLGLLFIVTALLLYLGIKLGRDKPEDQLKKKWWQHALIIGIFQMIAILPGVSRSGSTISGARLLGWNRHDAVMFSFLLVIPAILGGTALKLLLLFFGDQSIHHPLGISQYVAGFSTSFIFGYFALLLLIRLAVKEKFIYFVWYCLFLGIATTIFFS